MRMRLEARFPMDGLLIPELTAIQADRLAASMRPSWPDRNWHALLYLMVVFPWLNTAIVIMPQTALDTDYWPMRLDYYPQSFSHSAQLLCNLALHLCNHNDHNHVRLLGIDELCDSLDDEQFLCAMTAILIRRGLITLIAETDQ